MRNEFNNIVEKINNGELNFQQRCNYASELTSEILNPNNRYSDSRLISVDKQWVAYGSWKSVGFANNHTFGDKLSEILIKALTGKLTNDEDLEFSINDFKEIIEEKIGDYFEELS